jgi:hypothetical protein
MGTVDHDPGAVADLGEPFGEHTNDISSPPSAGNDDASQSAKAAIPAGARRQDHSGFGDSSGARGNLRLPMPVEVVALRAA